MRSSASAFLLTFLFLTINSIAQVSYEAAELTEAGIKHYENGNFDLALEKLTKAIELSSKPKSSKKIKTNALAENGDTELRDRITFHDPVTGIAFLNRGHVQFARAKMELAIFDYSEATLRDRWQRGALHMRAALARLDAVAADALPPGLSLHDI